MKRATLKPDSLWLLDSIFSGTAKIIADDTVYGNIERNAVWYKTLVAQTGEFEIPRKPAAALDMADFGRTVELWGSEGLFTSAELPSVQFSAHDPITVKWAQTRVTKSAQSWNILRHLAPSFHLHCALERLILRGIGSRHLNFTFMCASLFQIDSSLNITKSNSWSTLMVILCFRCAACISLHLPVFAPRQAFSISPNAAAPKQALCATSNRPE